MKKQNVGPATIAYQDFGKGHPLLMGHSFLWDATMWDHQVDFLKEHYRCIVPDLWSHGQSDPLPKSSYTIEMLANDYWQFTQNLGLKKFALIGLSVGGMWAMHLALNHPEAISALVLMDTFVGSEPEPSQKIYYSMLDELEREQHYTSSFADKVAPFFFAKNTAKEEPHLVSRFVQSLLETPSSHLNGKIALGRAIFSRNSLLEKLDKITIPTLIVVGEEDLARPPAEAQEMAKRIKNAELAVIPGAGHICTVEKPKMVNEVLNTFLNKHV